MSQRPPLAVVMAPEPTLLMNLCPAKITASPLLVALMAPFTLRELVAAAEVEAALTRPALIVFKTMLPVFFTKTSPSVLLLTVSVLGAPPEIALTTPPEPLLMP